MSKTLEEILEDVQGKIGVYNKMPNWKQHRRKSWEAYVSCVRLEQLLIPAIKSDKSSRIDR